MPGSHARQDRHHHSHGDAVDVPVVARARWVLLTALALAGVATVVGLVLMWPDHSPRPDDSSTAFAAPGVTFPHADVLAVQPACENLAEQGGGSTTCGRIGVRVGTGDRAGDRAMVPVAPEVSRSGLSPGDDVQLMQTPARQGAPSQLSYFSVDRLTPIWVLTAIFVVAVGLVARLRGLLALVGLAFGAFVLVKFMLPALLTGGSGLGVLNDVTITQASAVWELRAAAPEMTRRALFGSGMRIGRDHIASTIYTIVFAYAGAALTVLLLLFVYDRPLLDLLSNEDIAEEVIRTLASAIGLVLAVPATTAIAVAVVAPRRRRPRTSIL